MQLPEFKYFSEKEILRRTVPDNLFNNIIPTLRILDFLRDSFGVPIIINSTYRDPLFNKSVGGKPNSLHLYNNAIDFTTHDKSLLSTMRETLITWDEEHFFDFLPTPNCCGIGYYPDSFIHFDTRGILGFHSPVRWNTA